MKPYIKLAIVGLFLAASVCRAQLSAECPEPASTGPDTGTGCSVIGNGPTVVPAGCQYYAQDDSQDVFAATPSYWEIYVTRQCTAYPQYCTFTIGSDGCPTPTSPTCSPILDSNGQPAIQDTKVVLLSYPGTPVPQPLTVHPFPGELVTVCMGSGTLGFVSVGQDEAITNKLP